MKKHRIYLDNCCFNRPYDDQTKETIRLESEANLYIQERVRGKKVMLLWSFMIDFENEANPYEDQKESINEWKSLADKNIAVSDPIRDQARKLEVLFGIRPKEALHLACAIKGNCDYFITTDRNLIKKSEALNEMYVMNPLEYLLHVEEQ